MRPSRSPKRPSRAETPRKEHANGPVDPQRARHLTLEQREIMTADGAARVLVNDSESPLAWLARRKGRDGQPLIAAHQFVAGERLRADFTRGQMSPRVTSQWDISASRQRGTGGSGLDASEMALAARQRLRRALDACGPEFAGLVLDVCCFLRGLEDIERERGWPSRSAKVVLQFGLDRLAAHVAAARGLLDEGGPIGRRLDFLSQEFNREANTLCSKSAAVELTAIGLDLKAAIDQLREQVQNIE